MIAEDAQHLGYVHPFEGEDIWEGHSTLVDELKRQLPASPAAIVCSVGGGGLLIGCARGLQRAGWQDKTVLVAVETEGSSKFAQSLALGELVTIQPKSIATSLGAARASPTAFSLKDSHHLQTKVVSDADALRGAISYQNEHRLIEPACGAALSMALNPVSLDSVCSRGSDTVVVIVVCGGSVVNKELQDKQRAQFGV